MKARTPFLFATRVIVTLLVASISALLFVPSASAQSVLMVSPTSSLTVNPGDTIEAGYEVAIAKVPHPADRVTVTNAAVRVLVNCPDGNSQTITINLPSQSFSVPTNRNDWSPSGDGVYQGHTTVPSTLCGGRPGSARGGATFIATFGHTCHGDGYQSDEGCCHPHCFRFHFRRHHNGDDEGGSFSERYCEDKENRECESPETREHRECCKEK